VPKTGEMSGFSSFVLRLAVLALAVFGLIGGAMTLAADRVDSTTVTNGSSKPLSVVVPDVTGQVYVFAKGILEDAGLAWKVAGKTKGYAANFVQTQSPTAGTVLLVPAKAGTAPLVVLTLTRNSSFHQRGVPDDASPYPGQSATVAPAGS
jgi:hypothetical protein